MEKAGEGRRIVQREGHMKPQENALIFKMIFISGWYWIKYNMSN